MSSLTDSFATTEHPKVSLIAEPSFASPTPSVTPPSDFFDDFFDSFLPPDPDDGMFSCRKARRESVKFDSETALICSSASTADVKGANDTKDTHLPNFSNDDKSADDSRDDPPTAISRPPLYSKRANPDAHSYKTCEQGDMVTIARRRGSHRKPSAVDGKQVRPRKCPTAPGGEEHSHSAAAAGAGEEKTKPLPLGPGGYRFEVELGVSSRFSRGFIGVGLTTNQHTVQYSTFVRRASLA